MFACAVVALTGILRSAFAGASSGENVLTCKLKKKACRKNGRPLLYGYANFHTGLTSHDFFNHELRHHQMLEIILYIFLLFNCWIIVSIAKLHILSKSTNFLSVFLTFFFISNFFYLIMYISSEWFSDAFIVTIPKKRIASLCNKTTTANVIKMIAGK